MNLPQVVLVFNVIALTKGSSVGATKDPPCSSNEKFLNDLRSVLTSYLGDTTMMNVLTNLQAQKAKEVKQVQQVQQAQTVTGGAVFTRWGRIECPPGNELVYKGYAGGTFYTSKAGPATILCLPDRPIYANYTKAGQGGSYIHGTEYGSTHTSPNVKPLVHHDVPCAVCRSQTRRSVIMVPARNECLPGWRLEYWGYLMGGHYNYAASDYLCVDVHATTAIGGHESKSGQMLYLVESVCGSLPCPPYQDYWELTCVVCSKK